MRNSIISALTEAAALKSQIASDTALLDNMAAAGDRLLQTAQAGGTIYVCGNGGSAADSIHFVEELVARYKRERAGIRAMHFLDPGVLTCWGNDYQFESIFERQVRTFCRPSDVLVAISTSGNSPNIITAVKAAKELGTFTIGLTGKEGGQLKGLCDQPIVIPSHATERIQEVHITIIHAWCEKIDLIFTKNTSNFK